MKIDEFNRIYAPRKYHLELRRDNKKQFYLRLLDYAQESEVTQFTFLAPTDNLPVAFLEYMKTLRDGDLSN